MSPHQAHSRVPRPSEQSVPEARTKAIRCLIVDDSDHFLQTASELLERDGIAVIGVASTSADALRRIRELRPDVTLVDIALGEESGFDLAHRLAAGESGARPTVILMSTYAEEDFAQLIEASPAAAFLPKTYISGAAIREICRRLFS